MFVNSDCSTTAKNDNVYANTSRIKSVNAMNVRKCLLTLVLRPPQVSVDRHKCVFVNNLGMQS